MDARAKAYLISIGDVLLSKDHIFGPDSTAGPGAGGRSVFFASGKKRVRLSVADTSPLRLEMDGDEALILKGEKEIARGHLEEPLAHCPEQAYITVCEKCIYDCKFCAVPKLAGNVKSLGSVVEMVEKAKATGRLRAISLTSGVERTPEEEAIRVAGIVQKLQRYKVPIGVSVVPTPKSSEILKQAGAQEIKYNVETVDPDLFEKVCPGLSLEEIMTALEGAVSLFGKNHVFSNVIIGLGESDKSLRSGIAELAEIGVLPGLRAVNPHPLRIDETEMTRPSAERLLSIARYTRKVLDKCGLRGDAALTMCYRCTGCDLTPHVDL